MLKSMQCPLGQKMSSVNRIVSPAVAFLIFSEQSEQLIQSIVAAITGYDDNDINITNPMNIISRMYALCAYMLLNNFQNITR